MGSTGPSVFCRRCCRCCPWNRFTCLYPCRQRSRLYPFNARCRLDIIVYQYNIYNNKPSSFGNYWGSITVRLLLDDWE